MEMIRNGRRDFSTAGLSAGKELHPTYITYMNFMKQKIAGKDARTEDFI